MINTLYYKKDDNIPDSLIHCRKRIKKTKSCFLTNVRVDIDLKKFIINIYPINELKEYENIILFRNFDSIYSPFRIIVYKYPKNKIDFLLKLCKKYNVVYYGLANEIK